MARFVGSVGTGDAIINTSFAGVGTIGTVSIWAKPNGWASGDSTTHVLWFFGTALANSVPSLQRYQDNTVYAGFSIASDTRITIADTGLFANGVWAHWVYSWSNGVSQALYKNGSLVSAAGTPTTTGSATPGKVTIGNYTTGTNSARANLADFVYWPVLLSTTEIAALANGARPWTIRKPTLYFPIDGLQSPEPDLSGNAFNGTVTNTALASGPPFAPFTPRWPQFNFPSPPPPILMPQTIIA